MRGCLVSAWSSPGSSLSLMHRLRWASHPCLTHFYKSVVQFTANQYQTPPGMLVTWRFPLWAPPCIMQEAPPIQSLALPLPCLGASNLYEHSISRRAGGSATALKS